MKNTEEVIIFNQELGKRIEKLRKSQGMSREQFAEAAQLAAAFVYRVENGHNGVSFYNAIQIANALDIPLSSLVSEDLISENAELYECFLIAAEMSKETQKMLCRIIHAIAEET